MIGYQEGLTGLKHGRTGKGMDGMLQSAQRYSGKWVKGLAENMDKVCGSLTLAGSPFEQEVGLIGEGFDVVYSQTKENLSQGFHFISSI